MENKKINYALRPDANGFDEIRLKIVPRFKESELSGSEWRTSAIMEFYRKGELKHTSSCGGKIEYAAGLVYARLLEAQDNGLGYYAGDGIHCDQEGCSNKAKYLMKIKKEYCVGGGNCGAEKKSYSDKYRCFCEKHKTRGDQGLEDNDSNYEIIDNLITPSPQSGEIK